MDLSTKEANKLFEQNYMSNVLMMMFIDTNTHHIISANTRALSFYGYTKNEIETLNFIDLCVKDPDDNPNLQQGLNGQLEYFTTTQRLKNGQLKFIEVYANKTSFEDSKHLLFTLIDATERQQRETQLREIESRYRIIANFNHDWEYWITPDGLFGYISTSCERITGYTKEEFQQNPYLLNQIVITEDQAIWQEHLNELGEDSKNPRTITEFRIQRRDGEIIWIEHVSQMIIDEEGLYRGHRTSNRDITQRKQIQQKLNEKTEILKLAVESSGMGIWEWDIAKQQITYDDNWPRLLGYTADEIKPEETIWERLVHPQDKLKSANQLDKVINGTLDSLEIEQRLQNREGKWLWFMSRGNVVERISDGTATRFIGLDIDITKRKKNQEDAFLFALERQRVDVLASFMQSAKHEFKTPLSRINMKLYLLNRSKDEIKRTQIISEIETQVLEIDKLLENMMLMARLDTISTIPDKPADLREIINTLTIDFTNNIKDNQLQLLSEIPQELPKIRGNTGDLYEALYRILDNAIRYTPPNGRIIIKVNVTSSNVIIEILDTGSGITEDALPHIFERFFREDKAHTTSGIGLGLPIAKRIIDQHHGNIRVASQPDVGTTVQIRLPIRPI